MAIASIKDSTMMYFSCDVGKFYDKSKGVLDIANFDYESLMGVTFGMDKKQRVQTHQSVEPHAAPSTPDVRQGLATPARTAWNVFYLIRARGAYPSLRRAI